MGSPIASVGEPFTGPHPRVTFRNGYMRKAYIALAITAWVLGIGTCVGVLVRQVDDFGQIMTATLSSCSPSGTMEACAEAVNVPTARRDDPAVRDVLQEIRTRLARVEETWGPFQTFRTRSFCRSGTRAALRGSAVYARGQSELIALFHRQEQWVLVRYGAPGEFATPCEV